MDTLTKKSVQQLDEVAIRFCGDSGDGMQLVGTQFTNASAIFGNDVSTLPDFPAEIRAPAGSLAGVSGFQINFSSRDIHTPGDRVNAMIAMNPAALRTNIKDVEVGGIVIVNDDAFSKSDLQKAGYESNPLEDGSLSKYRVYRVPITKLNNEALKDLNIGAKAAGRCKNFYALGLVAWLYSRPLEPTIKWIQDKFGKKPEIAEANIRALKAGYYYGETAELFPTSFRIPRAKLAPGRYRKLTGNEAVALGLVTAAELAGKPLFYASYPITPASDILHQLSMYKNFGVKTFQAEDEIAAMASTLGAAFGGAIAATGTSGPGLALKMEAIGLGVMTELPVVIVDVQRGGPSTGLPTKTEQADLLQAVCGRNGECPLCVLAARSPADCFDMAIWAVRIATKYMVPVILLTDGYIGNGAEPWVIPDPEKLPKIEIKHPTSADASSFLPYQRNEHLARPWALPGTPGLAHRIGGIEKEDGAGHISYDPLNHQKMVDLRAKKVAGIVKDIPPLEVNGDPQGDLLVLGWGGTYGALLSAASRARAEGHRVSSAHLQFLNPFPANTGDVLSRFKKVLIPELNGGQLRKLIRAEYLVDAIGLDKVQGKPFLISEVYEKIISLLK
ncbi:MAG: 2-oxoacid:acceptor oxidoreductase subunit alpha [Phycisphaerae bacterium]|nr:2-oxoacid:acceptor oxidoreductase subunit alpha [Phycisphaerae bacterium]